MTILISFIDMYSPILGNFAISRDRSIKPGVHCAIYDIKGPFCDPQPHPPFFTKKVEIFTSAEAFRYIMFVRKIFLANSFV